MTIGRWATTRRISKTWAHYLVKRGRIAGAVWDTDMKRWNIPEGAEIIGHVGKKKVEILEGYLTVEQWAEKEHISVPGVRYRIAKGLVRSARMYKGRWMIQKKERRGIVQHVDRRFHRPDEHQKYQQPEPVSTIPRAIFRREEKKKLKPEDDIFSKEYREKPGSEETF